MVGASEDMLFLGGGEADLNFSDLDDIDYSFLAQSISGALTDEPVVGRRRSLSIAFGENVEKTAERRNETAVEAEEQDTEPANSQAIGRVERKKNREKRRRLEVNEKFDELLGIVAQVEGGLNISVPRTAASQSRSEVLARTIRVLRRLWNERSNPSAAAAPSLSSLSSLSEAILPDPSSLCKPAFSLPHPAAGGVPVPIGQKNTVQNSVQGMPNLPLMMFMPMFLPPGGAMPGLAGAVPSAEVSPQKPPEEREKEREKEKIDIPLSKPNSPLSLSKIDGFSLPLSLPSPPAFVAAAEEEDDTTYAVCA